MPDGYVAVAFFWIGLSAFGLGFYMGTNKANARWRAWLRREMR